MEGYTYSAKSHVVMEICRLNVQVFGVLVGAAGSVWELVSGMCTVIRAAQIPQENGLASLWLGLVQGFSDRG